jgi:hypothetical protein
VRGEIGSHTFLNMSTTYSSSTQRGSASATKAQTYQGTHGEGRGHLYKHTQATQKDTGRRDTSVKTASTTEDPLHTNGAVATNDSRLVAMCHQLQWVTGGSMDSPG